MTFQGERARPIASESRRFFEVSKVRLDGDGHVSAVLWGEVNSASDLDVGPPVVAPVAEVVDAIHDGAQVSALFTATQPPLPERLFVVFEHADGRSCIVLDDAVAPGRQLTDIARLDR